jgi:hypothetical protein
VQHEPWVQEAALVPQSVVAALVIATVFAAQVNESQWALAVQQLVFVNA